MTDAMYPLEVQGVSEDATRPMSTLREEGLQRLRAELCGKLGDGVRKAA
jgi:hypothetical protein